MAVVLDTELAFVVRDEAGRVVVMFWGADAQEEAEHWVERGFRLEVIARGQVAAA
jgi:hypothetical protein